MPRPFEIIAALDKAAALSRPEVRRIVEKAIAQLRKGFTKAELEKAVRTRTAAPLLESGAWSLFGEILSGAFAPSGPLGKTLRAAARRTAKEKPLKGKTLDFAPIDRAADRWLKREGARLVRQVTKSTKAGITQSVRDSFRGRRTLRKAARDLFDRRLFGLTKHQTRDFNRWVERELARYANPRSEIFDLTPAQMQRRIDREFDRRVFNRARTIARTESYNAGNAARRETWRAAVDQGKMKADDYVIQWVTRVIGVCPRCEALDKKTAEVVDGIFVSDPVASGKYAGEIIRIEAPTVHPRCYCALRTVRRKDAAQLGGDHFDTRRRRRQNTNRNALARTTSPAARITASSARRPRPRAHRAGARRRDRGRDRDHRTGTRGPDQ